MTADEDRAFLTFSPVMPRCADDDDDDGDDDDSDSDDDDDIDDDVDDDVDFVFFSDDGDYKCEITYLDINRSCPVVQVVIT